MKKYLYLVYLTMYFEGDYVREEDTKAFESLDDAEAYRARLLQYYMKSNEKHDDVLITKVEHVTLK